MAAQQVIVVGQGTSDSYPAVVFVDTISERDALVTNKIVIVRNAYKSDTSVNKGWAAYVLDSGTKKWTKIIEQESVDGPWGINEEIKKSLVTKATFEELRKRVARIDPDHVITEVNWAKNPDEDGGIKNRPPIEAAGTDPETGKPVDWTANLDHVKVGDVKKLQVLGGCTTFTAALERLNKLAAIFGADNSAPTGTKTLKMMVKRAGSAEEEEIVPAGSFREARVGYFIDPEDSTKKAILVVGGNQDTGDYQGLWWTTDGITLHQSNATAGDWEQPVYSSRLQKWAAACGTALSDGIRGIAYSSDGKTWSNSNKLGAQPEIELYEDTDTTLFMCGYSVSSNAESWTGSKYGGGGDIVCTSGTGPQAMPVYASGVIAWLGGYSGKCLFVATPASGKVGSAVHSFMWTLLDCDNVYNNSRNVDWYDIDSTDGDIVPATARFDSIQHIILRDGSTDKHFLFAPATSSSSSSRKAYYIQGPTGTITASDINEDSFKWKPAGVPSNVTNVYETPALCGDTIVMPTMSSELIGDGLYVISKSDFLEKHNAGQTPVWTHVTVAANGGTIHKGGYYKPEEVTVTLDGAPTTVYCTTGYKFSAVMLFSFDGINWYKSEYLVHSKPPFQFGENIIFPMTDNSGVKYITVEEFAESIKLSMRSEKPDTLSLIGSEWTEQDLVAKINALIYGFNSMVELVGLKV